ncbi:MAG: type IV secretory system conjugative DNA transfer family protein, partial [Bryobacterales bacterium]|nr:type IV secretory system conjugative DNA transfer family protein [Bryobacterales bacterium]
IGNQAIAESLKGGPNEINFRELKRKAGTVVSICLPLDQLPVTKKYFRVLASTLISDVLQEGLRGKGAKVLALFDETYQIGYLPILADAWGMIAGAAGLQMWAVYQDISQLMSQFRSCWQTILANCGTALFFGVRDQQTADYVSKMCGVTEVISNSRNVSADPRTGEPVINIGGSVTTRPLLQPDEVKFGLKRDEMLLFSDGVPGVVRANRKLYFERWDLRGKHRPNPYVK